MAVIVLANGHSWHHAGADLWFSMLGAKEFGTLNRMVGFFGIDPILWTLIYPMLSIALSTFGTTAALP